MDIFLMGFFDLNLGDDLMIRSIAQGLPMHMFYANASEEKRGAFSDIQNLSFVDHRMGKNFPYDRYGGILKVGGSMFIYQSKSYTLVRYLQETRYIIKAKKQRLKVATIGCNLGPFCDGFSTRTARKELRASGLITVRDTASLDILNEWGIKGSHYPDIVFSLNYEKDQSKKENGILGISVYNSYMNTRDKMEYYRFLARTADDYIARTKGQVRIFGFNLCSENDYCAAHFTRLLMEQKGSCSIVMYDGDCDAILHEMGECDVLIGTRFHSLVIGALLDIPILPVVYSDKTRNLLEDLGYSGKKILFDNPPGDVSQVVDWLLDKRGLFYLSDKKKSELLAAANRHIADCKAYFAE